MAYSGAGVDVSIEEMPPFGQTGNEATGIDPLSELVGDAAHAPFTPWSRMPLSERFDFWMSGEREYGGSVFGRFATRFFTDQLPADEVASGGAQAFVSPTLTEDFTALGLWIHRSWEPISDLPLA